MEKLWYIEVISLSLDFYDLSKWVPFSAGASTTSRRYSHYIYLGGHNEKSKPLSLSRHERCGSNCRSSYPVLRKELAHVVVVVCHDSGACPVESWRCAPSACALKYVNE